MTVATSRPLSVVLLAALQSAWALVGDGVAPEGVTYNNDGLLVAPYAVLYRGGPGVLDGPVSDPHADGQPLYQLTCVGRDPNQAEALADRLRPVLLARHAVTGLVVMQAVLETSQPVRRDDSTTPPLFYLADQVRYLLTSF